MEGSASSKRTWWQSLGAGMGGGEREVYDGAERASRESGVGRGAVPEALAEALDHIVGQQCM